MSHDGGCFMPWRRMSNAASMAHRRKPRKQSTLQTCNQLDMTLFAASHSNVGDGPWSDTVRSLRRRFYRGTPIGDAPATIARSVAPAAAPEQPRSIWDDPAADDLDAEIPF